MDDCFGSALASAAFNRWRIYRSGVQDTILKIVSYIFKIQYSILSGILRYLFVVAYYSIFKILFASILGKWKILFQDTFLQIVYFDSKVHFATVTC